MEPVYLADKSCYCDKENFSWGESLISALQCVHSSPKFSLILTDFLGSFPKVEINARWLPQTRIRVIKVSDCR